MTRPTERVNYPVKYKVRGALPFPIDMLRYDSAWPASEEDSHIIEASLRHDIYGASEVVVCARRDLTVGRWEPFGWKVVSIEGPV
jgi:hypothetical protein